MRVAYQQVLAKLARGEEVKLPELAQQAQLNSRQRQFQPPVSGVSRAELKARVRSLDTKVRLKCPFCELAINAGNLVQHCDKQHSEHGSIVDPVAHSQSLSLGTEE